MRTATTVLAICVSLLLAMGVVFLSSAVMTADQNLFNKQLIHLAIGLVACALAAISDYRWFKKLAWPIYIFAVICLLAVLAGPEINGSKRWLSLGPIGFQPSEVGKFALIISMALFAERYQRKLGSFKYGVLYMGAIGGVIVLLIMAAPDYGVTLALGAVAGVMMLVSGARVSYLVLVTMCCVLFVGAFIASDQNRMDRIEAYLHPDDHATERAYQSTQGTAAVAIGRGSGVGLADSRYKRLVPLHFSDFIFSVIGAELGFIGAVSVILLYIVLLAACVFIAWHSRDMFGLLMTTGFGFFICIQAVVHIGVVTSVLPNTGIPLPFISHGGTNLLFNLVAVGLVFSVARHGVVKAKTKKNPFDRHVDVPIAGTV